MPQTLSDPPLRRPAPRSGRMGRLDGHLLPDVFRDDVGHQGGIFLTPHRPPEKEHGEPHRGARREHASVVSVVSVARRTQRRMEVGEVSSKLEVREDMGELDRTVGCAECVSMQKDTCPQMTLCYAMPS